MNNIIIQTLENISETSIMTYITDFFNAVIFANNFIYINFYSIAHIVFGFVVMLFIFKYYKKSESKFLILFAVIILWELFEFAFVLSGSTFFRKDPKLDTLWDLISGMGGGYLYTYRKTHKKI